MLCFPRSRKFPISALALPLMFRLASGAFFCPCFTFFSLCSTRGKTLTKHSMLHMQCCYLRYWNFSNTWLLILLCKQDISKLKSGKNAISATKIKQNVRSGKFLTLNLTFQIQFYATAVTWDTWQPRIPPLSVRNTSCVFKTDLESIQCLAGKGKRLLWGSPCKV